MPLGGRAFEVVTVLVQSANEFVTKDHLMERVWPGAIVGEGTIHVHISAVRKALGPDGLPLRPVLGGASYGNVVLFCGLGSHVDLRGLPGGAEGIVRRETGKE